MVEKKILIYNIIYLFLLYLNMVITFAILYLLLDRLNFGHIVDHYTPPAHQSTFYDLMARSVYFSAITLLAVGYGDITPFGLSRALAVVEAMIGYILPAALVIRYALFPTTPLRNKINKK